MSSKFQPNFFGLNVRRNGPQPSIFVRSFSPITKACLELRRLLEIIRGVLYTPDSTLILRAVTIDLLFSEAERLSRQHRAGAEAPVTYDIKAVSQRLGIRPASVRQAYEQLDALGGVQILARQFPGRREQQRHLPMDKT